MADWNNPQTGQIYTSHFESIREKDNALAKMFDGTSETNLPDGAIKINSGSKYRIEKWDASASSWNTVIPGLGNLTQAEVDQLATIGSTTISSTQWGYLGNLDQNLRTTDSPDFGGVAISSTQYGYLGGLGSAPLEDDDLAANGGNIPEVNAGATITSSWTFQSSSDFLRFNRDGATRLFTFSQTSSGRFDIRDETAGIGRILIDPDGGVFGSNAGGAQGADTINFAKVYDNGNRVYSASNAPASTDLSDHESQVVELGGDFDAGEEVRCERIGNWVTITATGNLSHAIGDVASSSDGAIPSQFRPSSTVDNLYTSTQSGTEQVRVNSSGRLNLSYSTWSGSDDTKDNPTAAPSITYLIT